MRSFSSLVHDALFPSTRVYHDANGNYRGSSTDITPWTVLFGRVWGMALWLYIILLPLLAPVYFIFAHWFCRRYDAEFMKEDPEGWSADKKQILKNHRNILIGWIIFMPTNTPNRACTIRNPRGILTIPNCTKTLTKNSRSGEPAQRIMTIDTTDEHCPLITN